MITRAVPGRGCVWSERLQGLAAVIEVGPECGCVTSWLVTIVVTVIGANIWAIILFKRVGGMSERRSEGCILPMLTPC